MIKKLYILFFAILVILGFESKTIFAYQIDPYSTDASCIILSTTQYETQAEQLAVFEESMSSPIGAPIKTAIYFLNDPTVSGWLNAYGGTNEPPLANPDALNSFNPSGGGDFFSNSSTTPGWNSVASVFNSKLAQQILSFILDLSNAPGYNQNEPSPTPNGFVSAPSMEYIILLGNTKNIPPSDYEAASISSSFSWYPTDLIYADAGINGLTSIVPHYSIGRIPVNSTTEATEAVDKIISWFSNVHSTPNITSSGSWFSNIAFAGGGANYPYVSFMSEPTESKFIPAAPSPRIYWGEMSALNIINGVDTAGDNKSFLSGMNVSKYFLTNTSSSGQVFTEANVNTLLSTGNNGFVYLFGTGNDDNFYFDDGTSISTTNFAGYTSNSSIPIIISMGDDNTQFDTLNDPNGNSLGKSALLSSGGAVAFIGPDGPVTDYTLGGFYFTNGILHYDSVYFAQLMEEFSKMYHRLGSSATLGSMYGPALADFYNINSQTWNTNDYLAMIECELIGDPALYIPYIQPSSTENPPPQIQALNPGNNIPGEPVSQASLKYNSLNIPVYAIPAGSSNSSPFTVTSDITTPETSTISSLTTDFIDTRYSINDSNPGENQNASINGNDTVNFVSTDTGPGSNGPGLYFIRVANNGNIKKEVRMYIETVNQFTPSGDILVVLNDQFRWADQYPMGNTNPASTNYQWPLLTYTYSPTTTQYYDSRYWYLNALNSITGNIGTETPVYQIYNVVNLQDGQSPSKSSGTDKYGEITQEILNAYLGAGTNLKHKIVIWVTGKNYMSTFTPSDQTFVDSFLAQGGRLFVTGENIGYNIGSSGFYTNTLEAKYDQMDINRYTINGISTNPLSANLNNISITGGYGAQDTPYLSNFPEEIDPQAQAALCFLYGQAAGSGGPISSDGAGLIDYNSITKGAFVYLPFDFARISSPFNAPNNGIDSVLQAIINWLENPQATSVFTATPGNAQVNLSWTPLPSGQTGILIISNLGGYDSTQPTNGQTYSPGSSIGTGNIIYVSSTSQTSYTNTGLINGTTYYYTAYSFNASNDYSLFGNASATPSTAPPPSSLKSPTNLTANSQLVGASWQVNLTWQYSGNTESGFQIQRNTVLSDGTYTDTTYFTVAAGITNYTDTTVSANTTYAYMVRAFVNGAPNQYSAWSNIAITTTAILQAPTNLTAIAGQNQVTLQWINNSLSANGIHIQRSHPTPANPNPSFITIATLSPTSNTFVDSGIDVSTGNYLGSGYFCDGRPYYYQVVAFNQTNTETSNEAQATPSAFPTSQNPTNLQFLPGVNGFAVTWQDNTTTETAYYVEVWNSVPSDIANPETTIVIPGTITTGTMSHTVSVSSGSTWYTRVIALNSSSTGHPGFSLYATSSNGQDYAEGNIFSNFPTIPSGGGGSCFIATAAFGSYQNRFVWILRQFRNKFLLTNTAGKAFVRWYYKHSPPYANYIRNKPILKAIVRVFLYPLIFISWLLITGILPYLLFLCSFIYLMYLLKRKETNLRYEK